MTPDGDSSGGRRVWCPTCLEEFEPNGTAGRVEFGPQCVKVTTDGTVDLGHPWDVFLDWWHMPCGTKVRATVNARWDEELGDYGPDTRPMYEIDPADGNTKILTQEVAVERLGDLSSFDPAEWVVPDDELRARMDRSLASMMRWWLEILETVK
jgi:hypothetical protein